MSYVSYGQKKEHVPWDMLQFCVSPFLEKTCYQLDRKFPFVSKKDGNDVVFEKCDF